MSSFKKKKFDGDVIEMEMKEEDLEKDGKEKKKKDEKVESVGMLELFKFADGVDKLFLFIGVLFSIVCGGIFPLMFVVFGEVSDVLSQKDAGVTSDDKFMDQVLDFVWKMSAIGGGMWVAHYVFVASLNYTAERQILRIRKEFFAAVLKQDLGWYDTTTTAEFASRMTEDLNKMQDGMGEKVGMLIRFISTGLLSFIYPYIQNWLLSLVLTGIVPVLMLMGGIMGKIMTAASKDEMNTYGKAGAIAEEVLASIRTVVAFGGQKKEADSYSKELKDAKKNSIIKGTLTMSTIGLMFGLIYAAYGVGLWYGVKLIMDHREKQEYLECVTIDCSDCTNPNDINTCEVDVDCVLKCDRFNVGSVVTAIFGILNGGLQIGQSSTYAEAVSTAKAAAVQIFRVIDRVPPIDSFSSQGDKPSSCEGNISFSNVFFKYPARKEVQILDNFSLDILKGKTVALVGPSGCGKSTCIQLIQRLYDPEAGTVTMDGKDLKSLNVGWLRDHIGIVGQEPVLFDCTIKENIKYAKVDATDEEIEKACKEANAYDFIQKLPKNLNTMVGEGGAQLSGGQKQRIAIARALIRNPTILLLDEATSALDNESEAIVQSALDKLHSGRTTVVVAHRLSTVRNADLIVAIEDGKVKEKGTHDELMSLGGLYHSLVNRQMAGKHDDKNDFVESEEIQDEKILRQLSQQVSVKNADKKAEKEVIAQKKKDSYSKLIRRLMAMNSPEWFYILIGSMSSIGFGVMVPLFGTLFGNVMGVFAEEPTEARKDMKMYALMFGGIGLGFLLTNVITGLSFSISGARLVERVRKRMFESMLSQEVGWYDEEENNTGALCARLSTSAEAISSATGGKIGQVLSGLSIFLLSGVLAITYEWRLGLVTLSFLPPLCIGMIFQLRMMMFDGVVQKKALEKSAKIAVESITNVRTVAGLRCESTMLELYSAELDKPHKAGKKKAHVRGFVYGFANSNFMFAYAVCFYYGAWLLVHDPDSVDTTTIWKVVIMVLQGGAMIGMSFTALMDVNTAFTAAEKIFEVLDRKPKIDANPAAGLKLNSVEGNTEITAGVFSYPTRQNVKILRQLNLSIKSGEKIALVGQSGCGKSTVIQMIQRFYDFDEGSIEIENQDIKNLNVPYIRSKLGIVSQEPVLFNKSIAENIKYGDNDRTVSMEEVIEAAKKANIHSFVSSLPQGYDTNVGGKGTQLSGGQKQRVAIARAMIRNPAILLLDEATSALDTESEKIVQEALDAAQEGRTSITIAHRLSTIKDVDRIFVLEKGKVAECGTHSELLARKSIYFNLWNRSTTG